MSAYRSLENLNQQEKFGSWLLAIAHRKCLDWLKARSRSETTLSSPSEVVEENAAPGREIEKDERDSMLKRAIFELPLEIREVLLAFYFDKATYAEIAEMFGISVGTVNTRLAKARSQLKTRLLHLETPS